jgi:hypothetical protein
MSREDELHDAINLIYEAVIDDSLWPAALIRLADALGVAQIGLCAFDHRTQRFDALAPRIDPELVASYQDYWAFRDPIWPRMAAQPAGELILRHSLIPPDDYKTTAVYNEWFHRAKVGLGILASNLRTDDQFFTTIFATNENDDAQLSGTQALAFKSALPHFANAVRVHRLLRLQDLDQDTAPERLEAAGFGVLLVDGAGKVLFANAWARALLTPGSGLTVRGGYLFSTDRGATLHRLIASCVRREPMPEGPAGGIALRRSRRRPLRITVTPLRARGTVAELPWLGLHLPVAMITIDDPAGEKSVN